MGSTDVLRPALRTDQNRLHPRMRHAKDIDTEGCNAVTMQTIDASGLALGQIDTFSGNRRGVPDGITITQPSPIPD